MNRRDFLFYATAGGAALSLPAVALARPRSRPHTPLAHPRTIRAIGQEPLIRRLGRAYRTHRPEEDDPGVLASAIQSEDPVSASNRRAGSDRDAQIDQCIQRDFEVGRTVQLEGWILSMTEARQCALYSLLY